MTSRLKEFSASSLSTSNKRREEASSLSRRRRRVINRSYLSKIATTYITTSRITVILTNF
jgi:hypothetical protein